MLSNFFCVDKMCSNYDLLAAMRRETRIFVKVFLIEYVYNFNYKRKESRES